MTADVILFIPFVLGILLKISIFFLSGYMQRKALGRLLDERTTTSDPAVLTPKQKNVVLAVLGFSTRSITAASTLVTSLVAFLAIALKYREQWIWHWWSLDLILSLGLWAYIATRRQPDQSVLRLRVGNFMLLLACLLDVLGLIPTIIAAQPK
jgi:nicotinamide riboside transporter PnuC